VRAVVPREIPCTVKLRRAYDDTPEMAAKFEEIFAATYELGYAWAVVHCRTVQQKYLGPGKWEFLRDLVRRYPDRVIFGSGDIWTVDDIFRMHDYTGVHGVSVARGCIGNPWIFTQARALMRGETARAPTLSEQRAALESHFELAMQLHGEAAGGRRMRKFGIKFATHHPEAERVKREFIDCETVVDWRRTLERWYPRGASQAAFTAEP
jgi:tRNA-dihydrouridine synthase